MSDQKPLPEWFKTDQSNSDYNAGYLAGAKKVFDWAEKLAMDFERHLSTMEDINSNLGYPFSQPLIIARNSLKQWRKINERMHHSP